MIKQTAITTHQDPQGDNASLARMNDIMQQAGRAANETAARHAFADHTARKADDTIRRKIADLALLRHSYNRRVCLRLGYMITRTRGAVSHGGL